MNALSRILRLGAALGLLSLMGCGEWRADTAELTARTAEPAVGMDCASCHGYPLTDKNHKYHLEETPGDKFLNGEITCLDCHSTAIQFKLVTLFDSIYEEPNGSQWTTLSHPNPQDTTKKGVVIRSLQFIGVDTVRQNHPLPMPDRPGPKPAFQEYLTAAAHMNNKVDVVFNSRNSNPAEFNGDSASYNPIMETCSAVACHPAKTPYSWGSVKKNLPILKGEE